jgi:hypothetical protein
MMAWSEQPPGEVLTPGDRLVRDLQQPGGFLARVGYGPALLGWRHARRDLVGVQLGQRREHPILGNDRLVEFVQARPALLLPLVH